MANYTEESLYLPVGESLFDKYFLGLLIALLVCVVLGCVLGLFGLCKCSYKVVALMATGVVIKLALIPDVEDDLVQEKQPEGTNAERSSDTQSNHEPGATAEIGTQNQNSQNGTLDETETHAEHNMSSVRQSVIENVVDKVVFKTGSDSLGEPYHVRPFAPVLLIPLAALLIAAYASVIITAQWTITTKCPIVGTDNDSSICFYGLHNPPVDCVVWKNVGMQAELICVANSTAFDPFNPLERFVSLLAVQVAVLQFFACIINKGCCIKGCRDPPTRYSAICALDLLFILLVSGATAYVWTTQTDREDTFEKLTIPFTHLIAVSLAECLILSAFASLLCCEKYHKYRKDKHRRVPNQGDVPPRDQDTQSNTTQNDQTGNENEETTPNEQDDEENPISPYPGSTQTLLTPVTPGVSETPGISASEGTDTRPPLGSGSSGYESGPQKLSVSSDDNDGANFELQTFT
jgi:hypothetical protein